MHMGNNVSGDDTGVLLAKVIGMQKTKKRYDGAEHLLMAW